MNSCLYRCRVVHSRRRPKRHRFAYPCFVFRIDLDELESLSQRLALFSYNRRNLYSLRDTDHLQQGADSIKANVIDYLRDQGIDDAIGSVQLVTNLRTWGYVFNPVSFYFIHDTADQLICVLAEVANTFNEQKLYLVNQATSPSRRFKQSHPKLFYISPYSEPDTRLNFDLHRPGDKLNLKITESDAQGTYFYSALQGQRRPLDNRNLALCSLRFPFITLQVITAIHWQAARLYLKRVPHFSKSHRLDQQTETRTYLKKPPSPA